MVSEIGVEDELWKPHLRRIEEFVPEEHNPRSDRAENDVKPNRVLHRHLLPPSEGGDENEQSHGERSRRPFHETQMKIAVVESLRRVPKLLGPEQSVQRHVAVIKHGRGCIQADVS